MNSKFILLLGGIFSSLVVFFCLKEQYIEQENVKKNIIIQPKHIIVKDKEKNQTLITAKLNYSYKYINALLNNEENLTTFLKDKNYTTNIIYKKNVEKTKWLNFTKSIINFFDENNITTAKINSFRNSVQINATFENNTTYNKYKRLISTNNTLDIKDFSHLLTKSPKENNITKKETIPQKYIKNLQSKINKTLKSSPIYFEFGSYKITSSGKKVLDKIIKNLKASGYTYELKIEGHTNAVGNDEYNKRLSQKRADAVKKYLLKNSENIKKITSIGYGSQKPIKKNPKDKRNRRVEIKIVKGTK